MTEISLPLVLDDCDAQAIERLQASRSGAPVGLDAAHELLGSLVELRDAEEGHPAVSPDQFGLLDQIRDVGGATLHSPTLGALVCLRRLDRWAIPADWRDHAAEYATLAAAWCLAHGRDPAALARWREDSACSLVESWAATLSATSAEISAALRSLLADGYPPVPPEAPSRKKALAGATTPPASSSPSPKQFPAPPPTTGSTASPQPTCTGSARPPRNTPAPATPPRTQSGSAPTIPASTPASAGSASPAP